MNTNKKIVRNGSAFLTFLWSMAIANSAMALSQWGAPPKPSKVPTDIETGLMNMINWVLGFISIVAVLMVIWGGVLYLTSAGDETKAENGKKTVTYAFIGLIIAGLAYGIVEVIVVKILI
ncbi:MAG: hypothetical protein KAU07_01305 [Candidatus Andersenbacteria bacterium]|nr:hypothetical protein [Candidatus Andersenbacteria bacterium]